MSVQDVEGSDTLLASKWEIADDQITKAKKLFVRTAERGYSYDLPGGGLVDLLIRTQPAGRVVTVNYEWMKLDLSEDDTLVEHRAARKLAVSPGAGRLVLVGKDYDLRVETRLREQIGELQLAGDQDEANRLSGLLGSMHNARHLDLPPPPSSPNPIEQAQLAAEFQQILYRTLDVVAA